MNTEEIKGNAEFPYQLAVESEAQMSAVMLPRGTVARKMPGDEDIKRIVSLYDLWTDGDQMQTPIEFIKENW